MPKSGPEIIKQKYIDILTYIKSRGCKVIHVKYKNKDLAGTFDPNTEVICIDKRLKYTIEGCFTLMHEASHRDQYRAGKFKKFFDLSNDEVYSDKLMSLIAKAERDASFRAVKLLRKKWNIIYESDDLTEGGLKDYIKFWRKFYFKKQKSV
jgi:hypothetical protein